MLLFAGGFTTSIKAGMAFSTGRSPMAPLTPKGGLPSPTNSPNIATVIGHVYRDAAVGLFSGRLREPAWGAC